VERKSGVTDGLVGRILDGRYRIDARIARGGMATVYEATDQRLDRTVAVKVMHAEFAEDDEFIRRFRSEARSAARLSHDNVVAVFDTGDDGGVLFLVMEYVPGLTLRDAIRKEAPMSPAKALALIEPVLEALSAAHRAGILHRDIKPENVLLAADGRIKVADFGLAKAINSETNHTAAGGALMGTVSYLSPEIVVNKKADARADVYAVGVLIFEMLTGQKPHQADNPIQVAYKHVNEDIPLPSTVIPTIPSYVDALVARATAREVDLRPADAGVLLHQVRRVRNALEQGLASEHDLEDDLSPSHHKTQSLDLDPSDLDGSQVNGNSDMITQDPRDEVFDFQGKSPKQPVDSPPPATSPPAPKKPTKQPAAVPPSGRSTAPSSQPAKRRGPLLLIFVLALAGLIGYSGWYLGMGRYQSTPSVLDLTQKAATKKLQDSGLKLSVVKKDYDEEVPAGRVLSTDPGPNEKILKKGTVKAVVSLGPERHPVPDITRKPLDEAQSMIEESTLTIGGTQEVFNEGIPKGQIVSVDPAVGTPLKRGDAITLKVSKGKKPIRIPDFTNRSWERAQKRLTKLGFKPKSSEDYNDTVPKGNVVSQSPRSGTGFRGDDITLVVSKGPQMISVPRVIGSGLESATKTLEKAGFKVKVEHSSVYVGLSYVVGQTPDGGAKAPLGSTITLSIV
jgi:serine/threonine protein kinase